MQPGASFRHREVEHNDARSTYEDVSGRQIRMHEDFVKIVAPDLSCEVIEMPENPFTFALGNEMVGLPAEILKPHIYVLAQAIE
jgi:hypothetical protein